MTNLENLNQENITENIINLKWTEEEKSKLEEKEYFVYSSEEVSFARKKDIVIRKEFCRYHLKKDKIEYYVGIEGTAMDVDGDWGWCCTWYDYKHFEDALKECR
ncbi:MAG: hypothetical protein WC812_00670 [Candidatus Pacearchaeota archaeon]|jgi:hypothetical protein